MSAAEPIEEDRNSAPFARRRVPVRQSSTRAFCANNEPALRAVAVGAVSSPSLPPQRVSPAHRFGLSFDSSICP